MTKDQMENQMETRFERLEMFREVSDCVHLKACRRMSKIVKNNLKKTINRGCNLNCGAYENLEMLLGNTEAEYLDELLISRYHGYCD